MATEIEILKAEIARLTQLVERHNAVPGDGTIQRPVDLDEYSGQYKDIKTGEIFGLKILNPGEVRGGKTHHLKSHKQFIDCTEHEFRLLFERVIEQPKTETQKPKK